MGRELREEKNPRTEDNAAKLTSRVTSEAQEALKIVWHCRREE